MKKVLKVKVAEKKEEVKKVDNQVQFPDIVCPACGNIIHRVDKCDGTSIYICENCGTDMSINFSDDLEKEEEDIRTIGDIDCPLCGQTLVRLDEECDGHSCYWCDKCNIDISIDTCSDCYNYESESSDEDKIRKAIHKIEDNKDYFKDENGEISLKEESDDIFTNYPIKGFYTSFEESHIVFNDNRVIGIVVYHRMKKSGKMGTYINRKVFDVSSVEQLFSEWNKYCKDNNMNPGDKMVITIFPVLSESDEIRVNVIREKFTEALKSMVDDSDHSIFPNTALVTDVITRTINTIHEYQYKCNFPRFCIDELGRYLEID